MAWTRIAFKPEPISEPRLSDPVPQHHLWLSLPDFVCFALIPTLSHFLSPYRLARCSLGGSRTTVFSPPWSPTGDSLPWKLLRGKEMRMERREMGVWSSWTEMVGKVERAELSFLSCTRKLRRLTCHTRCPCSWAARCLMSETGSSPSTAGYCEFFFFFFYLGLVFGICNYN